MSLLPAYQPILHFEGMNHFFPKHPGQLPQPCEARSEHTQPPLALEVVQQLPQGKRSCSSFEGKHGDQRVDEPLMIFG